MATEWYYAKNGKQHGPVSPQELKRLANDGTLLSPDLVWKEGMDDWTPAGQIKGLLPYGGGPAADEPETDYVEPYRGRKRSRGMFGQILLMLSAGVLIATMFVPWWSMTVGVQVLDEDGAKKNRGKWAVRFARDLRTMNESELNRSIDRDNAMADRTGVTEKSKRFHRNRARFSRAVLRSQKWWEKHVRGGRKSFADYVRDEAENVDDREGLSIVLRVWGWNESIGIMGLVFGSVILVFAIIFLAVPPMRSWNWIVSLFAALMGLIALIFSLIWIFSSPGQDVGTYFRQGIIVGPYLLLSGGVLLLIVGIIDGIFGIAAQMRTRHVY